MVLKFLYVVCSPVKEGIPEKTELYVQGRLNVRAGIVFKRSFQRDESMNESLRTLRMSDVSSLVDP